MRVRITTLGIAESSATAAATNSSAGLPSSVPPSTGALPPQCGVCSSSITRAPEEAATRAACSPATPPPTTRTSAKA